MSGLLGYHIIKFALFRHFFEFPAVFWGKMRNYVIENSRKFKTQHFAKSNQSTKKNDNDMDFEDDANFQNDTNFVQNAIFDDEDVNFDD